MMIIKLLPFLCWVGRGQVGLNLHETETQSRSDNEIDIKPCKEKKKNLGRIKNQRVRDQLKIRHSCEDKTGRKVWTKTVSENGTRSGLLSPWTFSEAHLIVFSAASVTLTPLLLARPKDAWSLKPEDGALPAGDHRGSVLAHADVIASGWLLLEVRQHGQYTEAAPQA